MMQFHAAANEFYHVSLFGARSEARVTPVAQVFSFYVADGLNDRAARASGREFVNASSIYAVKNGMFFRCHMRSCGSSETLRVWIRGNSMPVRPS
jgi:hypothetical protein